MLKILLCINTTIADFFVRDISHKAVE